MRTLFFLFMIASASLSAVDAPVTHLTATRTHSFRVALPIAKAFTLFEPIGEKAWAEDWRPIFAAGDTTLSDDTVFTVERVDATGAKTRSVWLVTRYDLAAHVIEYRIVLPSERVSRIIVQCRASGENETTVDVTYRYTGLSEAGDQYIASLTDAKFRTMIREWDSAIRAYLQRGTPATP